MTTMERKIMTILTKQEREEYLRDKAKREHHGDMRYSSHEPPKGICKNRYCPEPRVRHDDLVRGYCEPCASIRRPVGAARTRGAGWVDRGSAPRWANYDLDRTEFGEC